MRPDLSFLRKNIFMQELDDAAEKAFYAALIGMHSHTVAANFLAHRLQRRAGLQFQVTKQVSDDLEASDFGAGSRFQDLPFPAPSIEFYFEDPDLPTIIMAQFHQPILERHFPWLEFPATYKPVLCIAMQDREGCDFAVKFAYEVELEGFLSCGLEQWDDTSEMLLTALSRREKDAFMHMARLAFKVLAFASIPRYKPQPLQRSQMRFGGKPGVCGRPKRPALHVIYLPKIVPVKPPSQATAAKHTFKGRRGHIHWYNADCFVHRRGTWDWLQPVADPATGKYPQRPKVKVRMP